MGWQHQVCYVSQYAMAAACEKFVNCTSFMTSYLLRVTLFVAKLGLQAFDLK